MFHGNICRKQVIRAINDFVDRTEFAPGKEGQNRIVDRRFGRQKVTETIFRPHIGREAPPRWEWRCFGGDLAELEERIGPAAQVPPHFSDELYLAHARSPHNAKIRDSLLDVKRLQATAGSGLELWDVAMKRAFPLTAPGILSFFEAMDLAPPALRGGSYALEEFLAEIIGRDLAFQAVTVKKSRRMFFFGGCRAEFLWLQIAAFDHESFCIEDERPARVEATLCTLGLDAAANVSFPKFLKSLQFPSAA